MNRDTNTRMCHVFLFVSSVLREYLREQLFEERADERRNFVSIQQVKLSFRVGVVVHYPVGIAVEGAAALSGVHLNAFRRRRGHGAMVRNSFSLPEVFLQRHVETPFYKTDLKYHY